MAKDTARRTFFRLLAAAFVAYLAVGAAACLLLLLLTFRLGSDGADALAVHAETVLPATAFVALVAGGAAVGVYRILTQALASRRLARRVSEAAVPAPPRLTATASRSGLERRVVAVAGEEPFSFVFGAVAPRVAVSHGLLEAATDAELAAVLEHERYHVRHFDPLKLLIARALPGALFYLPALASCRERYIAARELAADREALATCGRQPLVSALLNAVRGPRWPELHAAAAIGGADLLDIRVAQLETGAEPPLIGATKSALLISAASGGVLAATVAASLAGAGGPQRVVDVARLDVPGAALIALSVIACALPLLLSLGLLVCRISHRSTRRA